MGVNRRRLATTGLVVLAVLLGSLWAGGMAAPAAGNAAGKLAGSASLPALLLYLVLSRRFVTSRAAAWVGPASSRPDPCPRRR